MLGFQRCEVPAMSFELILPFLRPIEALLLDEDVAKSWANPDASWWYDATASCSKSRTFRSTPANYKPGLEVIANQR